MSANYILAATQDGDTLEWPAQRSWGESRRIDSLHGNRLRAEDEFVHRFDFVRMPL